MVPPDRARLGGAPHHVRPEAEGEHQLGIRARGKATAADAPPALPRAVDAAIPALHLPAHALRARGPVRRALRTAPAPRASAIDALTGEERRHGRRELARTVKHRQMASPLEED